RRATRSTIPTSTFACSTATGGTSSPIRTGRPGNEGYRDGTQRRPSRPYLPRWAEADGSARLHRLRFPRFQAEEAVKVPVIFDHPGGHSFCGAVLDELLAGLAEAGQEVEIADLHAEGFDPRMPVADEPDWGDPDKRYSAAVLAEQARIARNEMLVF